MTSLRSTSSATRAAACRGRAGAPGLLDFVPAGLGVRALCAHAQAWLLPALVLFFFLATSVARAALPPNTQITNTATASYDVGGTPIATSGSVTVTTAAGTPAAIQFLTYAPNLPQATAAGATSRPLPVTGCMASGGGWVQQGNPSVPGVGSLNVPGSYLFAPANAYSGRDVAFVQVTDYSANSDPLAVETITVVVSTPSGDNETLRLVETGPSTGVFLGYIPLAAGAAQPGNCTLQAKSNEKLTATYVQAGTSAVATSVALVDPLGLVFDSSTGQPIDGVRVTLVDVVTGSPAQVRGDDGVSIFPSTVVTGSTVTDSGGTVYVLGPGRYQFPRVSAPGTYRLEIQPTLGYRFPSQVADAALQQLPNAPYQLSGISRGGQFMVLPGPPVEADVPLDPGPLGTIDLTKTVGKAVASLGDFVPYSVALSTSSDQPLPGVQLQDRLPPGFRYMPGSARLNDKPLADPVVAGDGRTLLFSLGTLQAKGAATLRYVAAIGPSAKVGPAQNIAQIVGRISSNTSSATVTVQDDLNRSRAILAGQVTVAASCEADAQDPSSRHALAGVRVLLQDGTFVLTDVEGRWHVENLRPGTHVVQVDTTTLPQGMQLRSCEDNSRTGGRDFSQFVNVRGGTLWRADFRFATVASCLRQEVRRHGRDVEVALGSTIAQEAVTATVVLPSGAKVDPASALLDGLPSTSVQVEDGFVVVRLPAQPARWQKRLALRLLDDKPGALKLSVRAQPAGGALVALAPLSLAANATQASECGALPATLPGAAKATASVVAGTAAGDAKAAAAPALIEQLPYDDKWLAAADDRVEWLHPKADFSPALPIVKVAVKHGGRDTIELRVNGVAADPMRYEGTLLSPTGAVALSNWRSVDLRNGENVLEVVVHNPAGQVVLRESRTIHYGVSPTRAEVDEASSRLIADGRTSPVVAVRFLDARGKPVRRGAIGEFSIDAPFAPQQAADAIQREPLAGQLGGRARYEIGENGVALIPLQPTGQTGEAVLHFEFANGRTADVRAWLQSPGRDWVLVGFAEGTVGHKKLSGRMEALQDAGAADQLFDQDRVAFYAKGMIKGEYLLTAAYDSAKERGTGSNAALRQAIDPNRYYTLYGDATSQQYDAASIRNLYLKIEKKQFYLLFGDFDTGLTVTELGRYTRVVNGLKSEYKGDRAAYTAFATRTGQGFLKDEIQGDGTSGLYRLRARNIVMNSDRLRIEVRDRFQSDRVVATRALTPWLDYQIDYALGTVQLREPLNSRDAESNPQLLIAEYETEGGVGEAWTYGGRVSLQATGQLVVGATRIHEGNLGREGTLTAADATLRIDDSTKARLEIAKSTAQGDLGSQGGTAYVAEVVHDDGKTAWRAYAREQQTGFGLGQQSVAAQGLRSVGAEGRANATETVQVQGEASRQQDLARGAARDVVEGRAQWAAADHLKLQAGARAIKESDGQGAGSSTQQATLGVAYEAMEQRLVLRASTDLGLGQQGTSSTAAYPDRLVLGADYKVTPGTTLTAQHELAQGEGVRIMTTSVGLRTHAWEGAEVKGSVGSQGTLDADRLYASMGLVQRLRLNDQWTADAGIEQTRTLRGNVPADPLGTGQIPASGVVRANSPAASIPSGTAPASGYGLVAADFTAITTGLAYRNGDWSGSGRVEWRTSDIDKKLNLLLGAQRRLADGDTVAAGLQWTGQRAVLEGTTNRLLGRLSYAHRPDQGSWMWLDRLEYVQESTQGGTLAGQLFTRKLINNFNANWKANARTQVAVQYSAKYVREMLQDFTASGYTDLAGIEARYDVTPKIDVGLHAGVLHSWATQTRSYHLGLSVGYRLATNTWVSVGWNAQGFWDADFAGAEYRAKGLYLNIRAKFDQDTFDLNDRGAAAALQAR
ncbi:DUF11 domain-containing protein [Ramlibacter algicola]|uniref:DUF11 domain-containing protein n=1 Tax=Ramlibacter algicola TaxID=2795217 RepID=A0A934UQA8_9BURK|nr:DUF11 domain-containing protein [Ramlibacter algicola]MBK0391631.1 DUF11 domain-containing protein [Ramlibacter algicola]